MSVHRRSEEDVYACTRVRKLAYLGIFETLPAVVVFLIDLVKELLLGSQVFLQVSFLGFTRINIGLDRVACLKS